MHASLASLRQVIVGQMTRELHAIVQNPRDLQDFVRGDAKEEEVTWAFDAHAALDPLPAEVEMVGSSAFAKLRALYYTRALRVLGDVPDGSYKQGLISRSCCLAVHPLTPGEEIFQVLLGGRRESDPKH